jgi:hypothetical protein
MILPTHQAGDLIIIMAHCAINASPIVPAGWASPYIRNSSPRGAALAYKTALSSAETSGTWGQTNGLMAVVYRDNANYLVIGGVSLSESTTTTVPFAGLAVKNAASNVKMRFDSAVIAIGVWANANNTTMEQSPTGTTNRLNFVGANYEAAWHDTSSPVASIAATSITANVAVVTMSFTMEILDTGVPKTSGGGSYRPVNIRGGADQ